MSGESTNRKNRSIVTGGGDTGETARLFGARVSKSHPQIECCGAVDEFSAALGLVRAARPKSRLNTALEEIQRDLIAAMGEIASEPDPSRPYARAGFPEVDEESVARLEREISRIESELPPFKDWVLPGGSPVGAALEVARVAARRAERRLVSLKEAGFPVRPVILRYFNRVSDYLWLLAREIEATEELR